MQNFPEYLELLKKISSCQDLQELQELLKHIKNFVIEHNLSTKSKEYQKIFIVIDLVRIKLSNKLKTC